MSPEPLPAVRYLDLVLDEGSFSSWDAPIGLSDGLDADYRAALARARATTGADEAVLTGRGTIAGLPLAVVASEFGFLGGSIGVAAATRIEAAVRRATRERLPLLAAPASGGTRMQEGTAAFLQMVPITAAVVDHRRAGLPYLVHCRHPTTGGVFASWASLGQVMLGEPGALLGFLGPRVYRALRGAAFEEGVQSAENLAVHGIIDAVVPTAEVKEYVGRVLALLKDAGRPAVRSDAGHAGSGSAWQAVARTREPGRPGLRDVLAHAAESLVPLQGSLGSRAPAGMTVALARLGGVACVVVGEERAAQVYGTPLGPEELRRARRGMALASELGLPLVTVIDTGGAALSRAAEEGGLSGEIAHCLAELLQLEVPVVALLLGEGAGGAALALFPADAVVAAENAWLAPLPPEGASAILHDGDIAAAATLADEQGITAAALASAGIVDEVVAEDVDVESFAHDLAAAIAGQLAAVARIPVRTRLARRSSRLSLVRPGQG